MSLNDPRWGRTGDDQTKPAQTGGETPKNEAENTQPAGSDAPPDRCASGRGAARGYAAR